MAFRSIISV